MTTPVPCRLILLSPSGQGLIHDKMADLRKVPKRGVIAYNHPKNPSWESGTWKMVVEKMSQDSNQTEAPMGVKIQPDQVIAHRPFLVYQQEQDLTKADILSFFNVTS
mmetsp:Transcript_84220/g.139335  ORF Transcript_84220/g.139335 Transcript_84220/m.139335 type:complete len:107 (+) Transcript_84220:2-322(+)